MLTVRCSGVRRGYHHRYIPISNTYNVATAKETTKIFFHLRQAHGESERERRERERKKAVEFS
jgi:hypothetical protein